MAPYPCALVAWRSSSFVGDVGQPLSVVDFGYGADRRMDVEDLLRSTSSGEAGSLVSFRTCEWNAR